jgi:hypothetical protein
MPNFDEKLSYEWSRFGPTQQALLQLIYSNKVLRNYPQSTEVATFYGENSNETETFHRDPAELFRNHLRSLWDKVKQITELPSDETSMGLVEQIDNIDKAIMGLRYAKDMYCLAMGSAHNPEQSDRQSTEALLESQIQQQFAQLRVLLEQLIETYEADKFLIKLKNILITAQ